MPEKIPEGRLILPDSTKYPVDTQIDELSNHRWFAIRVRSRCEKAVAAAVRRKGFEEFLPLHKSRHRWSDRFKLVDEPLFPGYVFCRLNPDHRFALVTIPGVMHLVGKGDVPEPLIDREILAIREAIRRDATVEPWPSIEAGGRVQIQRGPLAGLEGLLVQADPGHRLVLGLSVLKQSVAVDIDYDWIGPMPLGSSTAI